ncbi:MAG: RNA-binding protein, partial [Dysgonamonadaceae bacterium]|nr:RNA-binding protein [Dysgonamonadaceae bacterium]
MNIFIAGLSYQISETDLRELFEEYGEVSSARIITDRDT